MVIVRCPQVLRGKDLADALRGYIADPKDSLHAKPVETIDMLGEVADGLSADHAGIHRRNLSEPHEENEDVRNADRSVKNVSRSVVPNEPLDLKKDREDQIKFFNQIMIED